MEGLLAIAPDGRIPCRQPQRLPADRARSSSIRTHTALSLLRRAPSGLFELAYLAINKPLQCVLPSGVVLPCLPPLPRGPTRPPARKNFRSAGA